jgi:hypothetical protein
MYRIRLAIVVFLLVTIGLQAQEGFYYQAVIKNTDGSPLKETPVKIRIRIIEGETTLQYEEVREITTLREGFISFIIGGRFHSYQLSRRVIPSRRNRHR